MTEAPDSGQNQTRDNVFRKTPLVPESAQDTEDDPRMQRPHRRRPERYASGIARPEPVNLFEARPVGIY
jgi:hypothetical protein